jgi:hypothetical protein
LALDPLHPWLPAWQRSPGRATSEKRQSPYPRPARQHAYSEIQFYLWERPVCDRRTGRFCSQGCDGWIGEAS